MSAITIISGTNRPGSNTLKVAKLCQKMLKEQGIDTELFSLENVPQTIAFTELFGKRTPEFDTLIGKYVDNSSKFLFITPEYNGSYPGILKTFLEAVHPKFFNFKKAGLIGVSDGRAGNLRGIEQLTLVLNYLKMTVFYNKLPISQVNKHVNVNGEVVNEETKTVLEDYLADFVEF